METLIYLLIAFVFFWIVLLTGQKAYMSAMSMGKWDRSETYTYTIVAVVLAILWPVFVPIIILSFVIRYLSKASGLIDYLEKRGQDIAYEKKYGSN